MFSRSEMSAVVVLPSTETVAVGPLIAVTCAGIARHMGIES